MKVVYTISGTLDVPDDTKRENLREAVLDAFTDKVVTESNQKGKTFKTVIDEDLVEYDVIEDSSSTSDTTPTSTR